MRCPSVGTGRRTRLKIVRRKASRFESGDGHHLPMPSRLEMAKPAVLRELNQPPKIFQHVLAPGVCLTSSCDPFCNFGHRFGWQWLPILHTFENLSQLCGIEHNLPVAYCQLMMGDGVAIAVHFLNRVKPCQRTFGPRCRFNVARPSAKNLDLRSRTLIPVSQVTTISSTPKPACDSRLTIENCERRQPSCAA